MRRSILILGLVLAACASPAAVTRHSLTAADAATSLAVGERVTSEISSQQASEGMDPLVTLTLQHADGRRLTFQQGNHTNTDLEAQRPDGALAQIMGLPPGAAPQLYHATEGEHAGAPFFCGPQGPAAIGVHETPEGSMHVVGLRQQIEFETMPDGSLSALPYSPDQVCARLNFRRG